MSASPEENSPAVTFQAVADAWQDIAQWVQVTLPQEAVKLALPDNQQNVGNLNACAMLNVPTPQPSVALWSSAGDLSVSLTSLKITTMSGVKIQAAVSVDSATVRLPLAFSALEVDGSYGYTQPCALYEFGKQLDNTHVDGHGSIKQQIGNGSLYYIAKLGGTVTLSGVTVNGNPTMDVAPDHGGLPDWMAKVGEFLSAFHEADLLRANLQSIFLSASFTTQMIGLINQKLGG
jgi:hypothetical protein